MISLHLGCGRVRLPGYCNVDIRPLASVDIVADLRSLPWPDASAEKIYSCAVIEHFGRHEWPSVLQEWARVLKPGGRLHLSTADFEAAIARYQEVHKLEELLGLLIGGQKDAFDWHGMIFDFDTLRAGLEGVGFRDVRRYEWRQSDVGRARIDDYSQAYLPHMDKDSGRLMMLNVEAVRVGS